MGSDVRIVIAGPPDLLDGGRRSVAALEYLWSRFLPDSDVSNINGTGDWVTVSPETITLFEHARSGWRLTGGAFDPTILPSLVANGYGDSHTAAPGQTMITDAVRGPAPGLGRVEIERAGNRIRLPEGIGFDPGGIGKGLAADLVATRLVDTGAVAAIVSIGGDVRVAGATPEGWLVSVENPFAGDRPIADLAVRDGAVCTSSVRARTWIRDGRTMHHLIDPASGDPMDSPTMSATVIAGEAWFAEVLTKAVIAADPVDALRFLESTGVEGIIVGVDRTVWKTPGLGRFAA